MTLEELKNRIRQVGEQAWMEGNLDALDEVYADELIACRPPLPEILGLAATKEYMEDTRRASSNIKISFDEMIGEGDTIAYRYTWSAKHTGQSASLPIPPTGKEITLTGCIFVHLENGKVVEEIDHSDYLGFLQQLEVIPHFG
jgi:predicted ester cyclase